MVEWTARSILHTGRSKMWDGDMSAKQQGIQNLKVSRLCTCLQTALVAGVSDSPLHWCRIQDYIATPVSFLVSHLIPGIES